jgi:hypothetical protein
MTLGRKTGGGSRLGKPNKRTRGDRESLRQYLEANNLDPLRGMADLLRPGIIVCVGYDAEHQPIMGPVPVTVYLSACKALAPYLLPTLRTLELTGDSDSPINFQYQLKITLAQAFEQAYGLPANQQNGQAVALPPVVPVGPIRRE